MKTCPKCNASLPDFANVCTRCKFDIAASLKLTKIPQPIVAKAVTTNPKTEYVNVNIPSTNPSTALPTEKKNSVVIVLGVVIFIAIIGFISNNNSSDTSNKLAQEQTANAQIAKEEAEQAKLLAEQAKQEAEQAKQEAEQAKQKAQDQIEQFKESNVVQPTPSANVNDLLLQASRCTVNECLRITLLAIQPRNSEAVQVATGRFGEFNPFKTGDRPAARALNNQGHALLKSGNPYGAIDLFKQASFKDPNDSEIIGNLGYTLTLVGALDEALIAIQSALIINPRRSATWAGLSEYFAKKSPQDVDSAIRALQVAYEFSGAREKTLQGYWDNSNTTDRPEMKSVYAEAFRRIKAYK